MTTKTKLDANFRRDSLDLRDRIYQPALIILPNQVLPKESMITILDQGKEGACTGFALAGMINYLNRSRGIDDYVSPRMLYEMAKRHDQWPGENYEGSSLRGAMKGWNKYGVCPETFWPYDPKKPGHFSRDAQKSALQYPLGAYYRIQHRRSDFHAVLAEGHSYNANAIAVSASVHKGWDEPVNGVISYHPDWREEGGHAFAIVGYNRQGFIVQNSWGKDWGGVELDGNYYEGLAIWTYNDFEANLWDAWVARMALPVESAEALQTSRFGQRQGSSEIVEKAPPQHKIRDHYLHFDDGYLDPHGDYPSHKAEATELLDDIFAAKPRHLLFYAHGGLNTIKGSASRVDAWRPVFKANGIHEIHFMWETGLFAELKDLLGGKHTAAQERAGGFGDWKDKALEKLAQPGGYALWKEMQADAQRAFDPKKDGTWFLQELIKRYNALPGGNQPKLHLVGHSAGSIWFGQFLERWQALHGPSVENLVLFAPACTHELYQSHILPALTSGTVRKLSHFLLSKESELADNVAKIYGKSLLWLVSRSFQDKRSVVPILGMETYLNKLAHSPEAQVSHYNSRDHKDHTGSSSHGGFDNDQATMNNMLRLVLGQAFGSTLTDPFEEKHLSGY